ncbi:hypothetical protein SEA_GODONK_204 [Gordonia phage GodonK]|uniref:Uncharacterized protein n=1 Tax=Gordonia phage GodonK TaxID=2562192 RepID=A0A4D6E423_9CAUD|nr:hypothetical protein HOV33_gp164 [Gordonia phage GodonK]QBZ72792.1 hypothetical protein SEA_GODONK_204 [Gordonia phage GodonK]
MIDDADALADKFDDDREEDFDADDFADAWDEDDDTDELVDDEDDIDDEEDAGWRDFSSSWEMEESDDVDPPADEDDEEEVKTRKQIEAMDRALKDLARARELEFPPSLPSSHPRPGMVYRPGSYASIRKDLEKKVEDLEEKAAKASTRKTRIVHDPSTGGTRTMIETDKRDDGKKEDAPAPAALEMPKLPKKHQWLVKKELDSYDGTPIVTVTIVKKPFFKKPMKVKKDIIPVEGKSPKMLGEQIVTTAEKMADKEFPANNPLGVEKIKGVDNIEGIEFR